MFELPDPTRLKVTNVSPRKENHGEDLVQAIDVDLEWETTNTSLLLLGPNLLDGHYWNEAEANGQASTGEMPSTKPDLRDSRIEMPIKYDLELKGRDFVIDHGLGGKSDLVLPASKVKKFRYTCKQGGTVLIAFQVQCNTDVNEKIVGKMCALEGEKVDATLTTSEAAGEEEKKLTDGGAPLFEGGDGDSSPPPQSITHEAPPAKPRKPGAAERAAVAKSGVKGKPIPHKGQKPRTDRGRKATDAFLAAHAK